MTLCLFPDSSSRWVPRKDALDETLGCIEDEFLSDLIMSRYTVLLKLFAATISDCNNIINIHFFKSKFQFQIMKWIQIETNKNYQE